MGLVNGRLSTSEGDSECIRSDRSNSSCIRLFPRFALKMFHQKTKGKEMTSYQRVMAALTGIKPDRVPVIPWVRDWCVKQAGFEINDMMENAEKYVYAQYSIRQEYGYDGVFDLCAIEAVSEAMGVEIYYDKDTPPRPKNHIINDYASDLPKLKIPNPYKDGRFPVILEVIRQLKSLCKNEIPVIGYLQGPLRHASTLRSYEMLMRDIIKNKDAIKKLLSIATNSLMVCGAALVAAGADIIMVSDPPSSGDMISRKCFEEWSFPFLHCLTEFLRQSGTKVILHICGDISDRLHLFKDLCVDAVSVDEKVDLGSARKILGDQICLFGNVSPSNSLCLGSPEDVERESKSCIEKAFQDGPFILSSGCLCSHLVHNKNISAMVIAAYKYGQTK